ncbi:hypothetical protein ACCO45_004054 [Purpureocillium lilacinum]|uniref:Uncharacterized protein n=1 Tax=Purpureocillium lilacinum TaxID=33203 RepID=A0ACC4E4F8_PURLI
MEKRGLSVWRKRQVRSDAPAVGAESASRHKTGATGAGAGASGLLQRWKGCWWREGERTMAAVCKQLVSNQSIARTAPHRPGGARGTPQRASGHRQGVPRRRKRTMDRPAECLAQREGGLECRVSRTGSGAAAQGDDGNLAGVGRAMEGGRRPTRTEPPRRTPLYSKPTYFVQTAGSDCTTTAPPRRTYERVYSVLGTKLETRWWSTILRERSDDPFAMRT